MLVTLAVGTSAYFLIYNNNYLIAESGFQSDPRVIEFLINERTVFIRTLVVVYFVLLFLLFCLGIFLSHRIAGPLYAFQRELTKIIKGYRCNCLKLRKVDELKFLESSFNKLNDFINERRDKRVANHQRISDKLANFLASSKNPREAVKVTSILQELDEF